MRLKKNFIDKLKNSSIFLEHDPINNIKLDLEDINSFKDHPDFIYYIYYYKVILNKLLYDKDENVQIKLNGNGQIMSILFYLNILIKESEEKEYIDYIITKEDIKNLYKKINKEISKNNPSNLKKFIISKCLIDLIHNFKGTDDIENNNKNEISIIEEECKKNIKNYKSDLKKENLSNLDLIFRKTNESKIFQKVKKSKLDYIYIKIVKSLIKYENFENYEFIEKILKELDFESIKITKNMLQELTKFFNKHSEDIIKNYKIQKIEEFIGKDNNMKKINFYYFLLKFILKEPFFIYNFKFLLEIRQIIKGSKTKLIKFYIDTSSPKQNNIINEKICFIIKTLLDCSFNSLLDKQKKSISTINTSNNLNLHTHRSIDSFLKKYNKKDFDNTSIIFHTNEKNKNQFFQYDILFSNVNDDKEFTFEKLFNYIQNSKMKLSKNYYDIIEFLKNLEIKIKSNFKYNYNLKIEINIKKNKNNFNCYYTLYDPKNLNEKYPSNFKDINIFTNKKYNKELKEFNDLINEINNKNYENEKYKEYTSLIILEIYNKEIFFKRKIIDNINISVENKDGQKKLFISNTKNNNKDKEIVIKSNFIYYICIDDSKEDIINIIICIGEKSIFIEYYIKKHISPSQIRENIDEPFKFILNIKNGYIIGDSFSKDLQGHYSNKINKNFDKAITINNNVLALLINEEKVIKFYNKNYKKKYNEIPDIPLIISQNNFELFDIEIENSTYNILLCAYENGILLVECRNLEIKKSKFTTNKFDSYCFCLIRKEDGNNFFQKEKYSYLLVGGLNKINNKGSIKVFKIIEKKNYSSNACKIDLELKDNINIISQNNINPEFESPITSIIAIEQDLIVISGKTEYKCKIIIT